MECLDCQISEIPEGHTGMIFLECHDRVGRFFLCSPCWRKRQKDLADAKEELRQKKIAAEQAVPGKKKKSGRKRGRNDFGPSH